MESRIKPGKYLRRGSIRADGKLLLLHFCLREIMGLSYQVSINIEKNILTLALSPQRWRGNKKQ
jgi:hypothetical protein